MSSPNMFGKKRTQNHNNSQLVCYSPSGSNSTGPNMFGKKSIQNHNNSQLVCYSPSGSNTTGPNMFGKKSIQNHNNSQLVCCSPSGSNTTGPNMFGKKRIRNDNNSQLVRYSPSGSNTAGPNMFGKKRIRNDNNSQLVRYSPSGSNTTGTNMFGKKRIRNDNNSQLVRYSPSGSSLLNEAPDLSIVPYENKVKETLKLFRDLFNELSNEQKREPKRKAQCMRRFDIEAAILVKAKGKSIFQEKCFGHIPGIKIGDKFHYRAELSVIGLHLNYIAGIEYTKLDGKQVATSVVNSGRYANEAKTPDVLIYSGQGVKEKHGKISDQELKLGNLALVNSHELKTPIRVIRKTKNSFGFSEFVYDGLYTVNKIWKERDYHRHQLVFKFELHRMSDQEQVTCNLQSGCESRKMRRKDCCLVIDVSHGRERFAVRAMNRIDGDRPGKFAYVTETVYPEWCKKIEHGGCYCTDGCSDSGRCVCVLRNGGGVVYECGPFCKCPDSCPNRVSQRGPQYQLELFKAESNRWCVRSRSYISSGNFVCEYVGKLQKIKESNVQKVDHDDPRGLFSFPIPKLKNHSPSYENEMMFVIDASKVGNVGRFIRHSKSPSLVVRFVLYDHGDVRMPHVMFFAAKNIPPSHELTCDYEQYQMMVQI